MPTALAVFLITLGLGQLISTTWGLRGVSLVGANRLAGYGLGFLLLLVGAMTVPARWSVLGWTPIAGPLAVMILLAGGSFIAPPPHPNLLFAPDHPAHAGCRAVQIPDGDNMIPGLLLWPLSPANSPRGEGIEEKDKRAGCPAVCIVPGAGDTKTFFKWRLVKALLAEGLAVLTIDMPGHGDYRYRSLAYPQCLSTIPAVIKFLRQQPGVTRVGLIGISLGGAMAIKSLVENGTAEAGAGTLLDALVVLETPVHLRHYRRTLFYQELWRTLYQSPVLSLLREASVKQIWQEWRSGGYFSRHTTAELFGLLQPLENISRLKQIPLLLIYSGYDQIAPPAMARAMHQAAPQAAFIQAKKASHVMLTLLSEINRQVAWWLREQLTG
ncbi:MAG: alpha/beta fold hydrolase [Anaerolineae bacterium]|nr:alpha/beta fold hydrolase [Anaerolineae bacterium]